MIGWILSALGVFCLYTLWSWRAKMVPGVPMGQGAVPYFGAYVSICGSLWLDLLVPDLLVAERQATSLCWSRTGIGCTTG